MTKINFKNICISIAALAAVSTAALTITATTAQAKGKHHHHGFHGKYYKNPYLLDYDYICEPQYIQTWVYSKHLGRKVRRTIRTEDRCNVYYK